MSTIISGAMSWLNRWFHRNDVRIGAERYRDEALADLIADTLDQGWS